MMLLYRLDWEDGWERREGFATRREARRPLCRPERSFAGEDGLETSSLRPEEPAVNLASCRGRLARRCRCVSRSAVSGDASPPT